MNDLLTLSIRLSVEGLVRWRPYDAVSIWDLNPFYEQIQEVEKLVIKISSFLKNFKDANEESKAVTKASAMKGLSKSRWSEMSMKWERLHVTRNRNFINKENQANRLKPGCEKGSNVNRSRTNVTNGMIKKFKDLITEFQVSAIAPWLFHFI